jgi:NADP-dependent 3-hydroxy acid dehydrogenase YdfG
MQAGGITGVNIDEYRRVFEINVFGTLYCWAAAVPHMLKQGGGDIVNITSLAGRKGGPETNAYSASKHAANSMTDAMRQELGGKNIRVAYLMPGATATEVGDSISNPNWRKAIQAHVAKDGAVQPSEIGETIVFMLSMPRHVNISEITVRPTIDTTA